MSITPENTAQSLVEKHGTEIMQLASMAHLTKTVLMHYAGQFGIDLAPTLKTLDQCIESHLIDRDIHPHALNAALADLQGAGAPNAPAG